MNSIKSLKNIVEKLTDEEIKILIKYLKYNSGKNKDELKSIQLLNLLKSKIEYSIRDFQNIIYGKPNYNAFNKLVNRLKQKIFEIISFDSSLSSNNFSKRNNVLLELRKTLLQADILQLKGLRSNIIPVYNSIIKRSEKFELYDIQIQALTSKQRLQSINSKHNTFKKINDEIVFAENCLNALKKSNDIYKEIINKISNYSNYSSNINDLIIPINNLRELFNISKSPTINFYLNTLSAEMWQDKLMYRKAQNSLEKVRKILLNNESAFTENRYGTILINLSNNNLFLYRFDEAVVLANESKKYFKNLPYTLKIVDEILFYAFYYKFDYENCRKILEGNKINFDNDILKNKFIYYQSCLYFVFGNYKDALINLLNYSEIERDKEGWNINRRILLIIIRIELFDNESVELDIQSLDRFIKRILKNKIIKPRYKIILRILSKLIIENYNFKKVFEKRIKYFNLLESRLNEYKWDIKSPELIIFQDWFKSKIDNSMLNNSLIRN